MTSEPQKLKYENYLNLEFSKWVRKIQNFALGTEDFQIISKILRNPEALWTSFLYGGIFSYPFIFILNLWNPRVLKIKILFLIFWLFQELQNIVSNSLRSE